MLDVRFYSGEISSLVLFLAGLGASLKLILVMIEVIWTQRVAPPAEILARYSDREKRFRRVSGWLLLVFNCALLVFAFIYISSVVFDAAFLAWTLLLFSLLLGLLAAFALMSYHREDGRVFFGLARIRALLTARPIDLLTAPITVSIFVSFLLFFSYALGATRIRSLAVADEVCLLLDGRVIVGKILGETGSGILLLAGEYTWNGKSLSSVADRLLRFGGSDSQVFFVNYSSLIAIDSGCTSKQASEP